MRKRVFGAIFCTALLTVLIPCMGVSVYAAEEYHITVNDTPVTSDNASDVLGDGTVSYDAGTGTLYMDSASLQKIKNESGEVLTMELKGASTVSNGSGSLIASDGPLTITGEGSMTVDGKNGYVKCIYASSDITIEEVSLNLINSTDSCHRQ